MTPATYERTDHADSVLRYVGEVVFPAIVASRRVAYVLVGSVEPVEI